jgi:acetyltransferase-like isoleucine patch superfamily enzyme
MGKMNISSYIRRTVNDGRSFVDYKPEPRYFNVNHFPKVGKSVSLVNALLDCNAQITIGDYVSFGHDCRVLTGYHDMTLRGAERQASVRCEPITIKDGVWIASGVTICPGVTIGENSVIGAGSVVTRDVPENCFYAGVPAKFIRTL